MSEIIVTRTPLRISFAGGGTDFAEFYREHGGAVLSVAINKYVYVTIKTHSPLFSEPIRLNYSETEMVESVGAIRNDIARECLRLLNITPPIYISTVADLPASSGLGSSSSFAVGLLKALHRMMGETVSAGQLAHEACKVEIDVLGKPIGVQDQYAAAFGGLNFLEFKTNGDVAVTALTLSLGDTQILFDHIMVFWTGITRSSSAILSEQKERTDQAVNHDLLKRMRDQAYELHDCLKSGLDLARIGAIMDRGWRLKRGLASTITNNALDGWYRQGMDAGALGGKLSGAGGGGFLLFVVAPDKRAAVAAALADLPQVELDWDPKGAAVLYPSR